MNSRDEQINANLGLVHACAKRFKGRGIEYEDLYGAGCLGLVKAFDNFDTSRGLMFSTYAVPVILGEMRRLFRDGGAVKVGRSLKELSLKVTRTSAQFVLQNGRDPQLSELSELLDITPEQVSEALCAAQLPISLTLSEDDGENGRELDIATEAPDEKLSELLSLKQVIGELESGDRALIILRFFKNQTQCETAKKLGMTQVQVSRREKKILTQLKVKLIV